MQPGDIATAAADPDPPAPRISTPSPRASTFVMADVPSSPVDPAFTVVSDRRIDRENLSKDDAQQNNESGRFHWFSGCGSTHSQLSELNEKPQPLSTG